METKKSKSTNKQEKTAIIKTNKTYYTSASQLERVVKKLKSKVLPRLDELEDMSNELFELEMKDNKRIRMNEYELNDVKQSTEDNSQTLIEFYIKIQDLFKCVWVLTFFNMVSLGILAWMLFFH